MSEEKNVNEKVNKKVNKKKKPNKFVMFFKNIGKKFKEIWSELKKVTWPSFAKVLKQTGVVLGVVALFLIVITGIDSGFGALLKLILPR